MSPAASFVRLAEQAAGSGCPPGMSFARKLGAAVLYRVRLPPHGCAARLRKHSGRRIIAWRSTGRQRWRRRASSPPARAPAPPGARAQTPCDSLTHPSACLPRARLPSRPWRSLAGSLSFLRVLSAGTAAAAHAHAWATGLYEGRSATTFSRRHSGAIPRSRRAIETGCYTDPGAWARAALFSLRA